MGVGGDDRLGAFALETAPHSIDVECGPGAEALQDAEAGLAEQGGNADPLAVLLEVEGKSRERLAIEWGQLSDVVVETRALSLAHRDP